MKKKLFIICFLIILYSFMFLEIILPDKEISTKEKRYLKQVPSFKLTNNYVNDLEDYLLDQAPFRDNFRSLKAVYNYYLMHKLENNDIILQDNNIYKSIYPTNYKSILNYFNYIDKTISYLNKDNNIYLMIVPDKNYYLNKNILNIDYNYIFNKIDNKKINFIDLRDSLSLNDYYHTDPHWREEKLNKVLRLVLQNVNIPYEDIKSEEHIYSHFQGTYAREVAINNIKDKLIYLTNDDITNAKVTYLENKDLKEVYNLAKLDSFDSYEVFLDGASAFIEITNNLSRTSRELVVFRDSFASSFIPLLIPYYQKITLIDNRYIGSDNYLKHITFTNQDVIFLNSTLLINESSTLKY